MKIRKVYLKSKNNLKLLKCQLHDNMVARYAREAAEGKIEILQ